MVRSYGNIPANRGDCTPKSHIYHTLPRAQGDRLRKQVVGGRAIDFAFAGGAQGISLFQGNTLTAAHWEAVASSLKRVARKEETNQQAGF